MLGGTNSVVISLNALFPIGATYTGSMLVCPLIALMPGTTWTLESSSPYNIWRRTA